VATSAALPNHRTIIYPSFSVLGGALLLADVALALHGVRRVDGIDDLRHAIFDQILVPRRAASRPS
jgi:hypothetical protein